MLKKRRYEYICIYNNFHFFRASFIALLISFSKNPLFSIFSEILDHKSSIILEKSFSATKSAINSLTLSLVVFPSILTNFVKSFFRFLSTLIIIFSFILYLLYI